MKDKNILIFPGGSDVGIEIWKSLRFCKNFCLFGAGANISNHGPYIFKNYFDIPFVNDDNWIDVLNYYIEKYEIHYIFPAHDDVVLALVNNQNSINAQLLTSPKETCEICRSKLKTYNYFRNDLPVPKIYQKQERIKNLPVFVKPDIGQGSKDAIKVNDINYLNYLINNIHNLLVVEYLPGKEYTVDCFTDRKKGLLFCKGRERIRTKAGAATNTKLVDDKLNNIFYEYANIINSKLKFYGAWFFQVKENINGDFCLLEIAPRIAGTMSLNRSLGVNLPLLTIYEAEGIDIKILQNKFDAELDRSYVNRYKHKIFYDKVYVDFDDTLIINNKINTELIKFIYQSINRGCKIILITKTKSDLYMQLNKYRIEKIFDEIYLINENESKADYINPQNSIFIDDSFNERFEVANKLNIPTFDCSMIELLLDDRC